MRAYVQLVVIDCMMSDGGENGQKGGNWNESLFFLPSQIQCIPDIRLPSLSPSPISHVQPPPLPPFPLQVADTGCTCGKKEKAVSNPVITLLAVRVEPVREEIRLTIISRSTGIFVSVAVLVSHGMRCARVHGGLFT